MLLVNKQPNDFENSIMDDMCGCMVSKWTSLEFKRIITCDNQTYLHITCVYLEPFSAFDYCDFVIKFEDIPENILTIYKYANKYTTFSMDDEKMIKIMVPYIYKEGRTVIKRCNLDAIEPAFSPSCIHINEPQEINYINYLFRY